MARELTPNVDIGYFETMAFSMASMAYNQYLRELIIEKIDDPQNLWDDRALAMFDALFQG